MDTCVNSGLLKYDILIKANVSIVVYWLMIFWLKQSDNGGLLNDDKVIPVSIVVYWMMIFWLKQSDTWKLKQSDTCVNGGLLNDDILIKKSDNVSIVVYWMMIFWLKVNLCQWWFIEWWYFD